MSNYESTDPVKDPAYVGSQFNEEPEFPSPLEDAGNLEVVKTPLPQSNYRGVSYAKRNKKWSAKVLLNKDEEGKRKLKHVGYFSDDLDAALARNLFIEENNLVCKKSEIGG